MTRERELRTQNTITFCWKCCKWRKILLTVRYVPKLFLDDTAFEKRNEGNSYCGIKEPTNTWAKALTDEQHTYARLNDGCHIGVSEQLKKRPPLVCQTNPAGVQLFSYVRTFFCFSKIAFENALQTGRILNLDFEILKTERLEIDGVMLIMWFAWASFAQTKIKLCRPKTFHVNPSFYNSSGVVWMGLSSGLIFWTEPKKHLHKHFS